MGIGWIAGIAAVLCHHRHERGGAPTLAEAANTWLVAREAPRGDGLLGWFLGDLPRPGKRRG